jgi:hypothetical protein
LLLVRNGTSRATLNGIGSLLIEVGRALVGAASQSNFVRGLIRGEGAPLQEAVAGSLATKCSDAVENLLVLLLDRDFSWE